MHGARTQPLTLCLESSERVEPAAAKETFSPGISWIRMKRSSGDTPAAETTPSFKAFNNPSRVSLGRPDMKGQLQQNQIKPNS